MASSQTIAPKLVMSLGVALGWLTGDVTHWMYAPDVPEGAYEEGWEMVEVEEEEHE